MKRVSQWIQILKYEWGWQTEGWVINGCLQMSHNYTYSPDVISGNTGNILLFIYYYYYFQPWFGLIFSKPWWHTSVMEITITGPWNRLVLLLFNYVFSPSQWNDSEKKKVWCSMLLWHTVLYQASPIVFKRACIYPHTLPFTSISITLTLFLISYKM